MRVYKLKLAKLTKKMAKIRPGAANGLTAVTAERPPPKKTAKIDDFRSVLVLREKIDF